MSRTRLVFGSLLWLSSTSCGDSSQKHSNTDLDAGALDAAALDAGHDAGSVDSGPPDPWTLDCTLTGGHFEAPLADNRMPGIDLGMKVSHGELLFAAGCGGADAGAATGALSTVDLPSNAAPGDVVDLDHGQCSSYGQMAVASLDTSLWAFFVRNGGDGDVLETRNVKGAGATTPTTLLKKSGAVANALAAGVIGGHAVTAYAYSNGPDAPSEIALFFDGSPQSQRVVLPASAGEHVGALAVGALGTDQPSNALAVLAWVDTTKNTGGVRIQVLDRAGGKVGDALRFSTLVGALNRISLAEQLTGGAVVFSEGQGETQRVLFVSLDKAGALRSPKPVRVTDFDQNALDVAVAPFAVGYAVAYRFIPIDAKRNAVIRLAFTDDLGNVAGTRDLADAEREAAPVRAALALDGRLFVAWVDRDAKGKNTLRAVRGECE